MTGGDEGPGVASMTRLIRPTAPALNIFAALSVFQALRMALIMIPLSLTVMASIQV